MNRTQNKVHFISDEELELQAEGNAVNHLFEDEEETHSAARKTGYKDGYIDGYKAAEPEMYNYIEYVLAKIDIDEIPLTMNQWQQLNRL